MPPKKAAQPLVSLPSRRRSGRLSATPKKSVYFDDSGDSEDELAQSKRKRGRPVRKASSSPEVSEDQYQESSQQGSEVEEEGGEEGEDDDYDSEEEAPPKKRGRLVKSQGTGRQMSNGSKSHGTSNANGVGVKEDDSDSFDESAPPKVTIIPLVKLRDTGGVEYEDEKLHNNTMLFLGDLKVNNQRPWLKCK